MSPEDAYHTRTRRAKEAKKNQHHNKVGDKGGKVQYGPPKTPSDDAHAATPPPPPPTYTTYNVDDGSIFFPSFPSDLITDVPNNLPIGVPSGIVINVWKSGTGWYTLSSNNDDNKKMITTEGVTTRFTVPAYAYYHDMGKTEISRNETHYVVGTQLFNKIVQCYRNKKLTPDIVKGVYSLASTCMIPALADHTAAGFIAVCERNDSLSHRQSLDATLGRLNGRFLRLDPYLPQDGVFTKQKVNDIGSVLVKAPYLKGIYSPPEFFRTGVKVVSSWGIENKPVVGSSNFVPLPDCEHDRVVEGHRTMGFGMHLRPCVWENTNPNLNTAAAKRTFGAVVHNDNLRQYSYNLANSLNNRLSEGRYFPMEGELEGTRRNNALRLCNGGRFGLYGVMRENHRIKSLDSEWVPPKDPLLSEHYNLKRLHTYLVDRLVYLVMRTKRGRIAHIFDAVRTTLHQNISAGKLLYYETARHADMFYNLAELRGKEVRILHLKREERMKMHAGVLLEERANTICTQGELKLKTHELAKCKDGEISPGRTIGAFGTAAIISTSAPKIVKDALDGVHYWDVDSLHVSLFIITHSDKKSISSFLQACEECRCIPDSCVFFCSSDDMGGVMNVDGRFYIFNADISKNDMHCDSLSFFTTWCLYNNVAPDVADSHLALAVVPIVMKGVDGKSGVKYQFAAPTQHSGLPNTTDLNNTSSTSILSAFAYMVADRKPGSEVLDLTKIMQSAGYVCGHMVTVQMCSELEGLQVLKNSPFVLQDGFIGCFVNAGAILRSFGSCEGDLDAKKLSLTTAQCSVLTIDQRFDRFCGGVVRGFKHEPKYRILNALRNRYCPEDSDETFEILRDSWVALDERDNTDYSQYEIDDSITKRYGLTEDDYLEFENMVSGLRVGQYWQSTLVNKVIFADYGYSDPDQPEIISSM